MERFNGVICIDKPRDFTSFDVIGKLRGMLRMKKLGHAGTLDPMATGVLPVFAGTATRACDILPDHSKSYTAEFLLGLSTDTQDITGSVISKRPACRTAEDVEKALAAFRGRIMQVPPMYSAVSVNGRRLYDLAREGKVVERPAREAEISSLELVSFDEELQRGTLKVSCSGGTYIRTLVNDMGEALGCGGVLSDLRRTRACGFDLKDCLGFEDVERHMEEGTLEGVFLPVDRLFESYAPIALDKRQTRLYKNGVKLEGEFEEPCGLYRIYGCDGGFIGLGEILSGGGTLKVKKNFFS